MGKTVWTEPFSQFTDVKIYQPISGSSGAGRSAQRKVLLVTRKGDKTPLGTKLMGTRGSRDAEQLAHVLADTLGLNVTAE